MEVNSKGNLTTLIFLPSEVQHLERTFLHGEMELTGNTLAVYVTKTCKNICKECVGLYSTRIGEMEWKIPGLCNWIHLSKENDNFTLKIFDKKKWFNTHGVVLVYYDRDVFIQSGNSLLMNDSTKICDRDHFRSLIHRLKHSCRKECQTKIVCINKLFLVFKWVISFLSVISKKLMYFTKCFTIMKHIDNYISSLVWFMETKREDEREHIKKSNFLLSVVLDVLLGVILLNWLSTHFSPDSFHKFVISAESLIQSFRDLIHWLTGDPAGFKLNYAFSKMLAIFFLFYIDVWCAFIAILRPAYKIIFLIFINIGKAGISFQVSMIADVLAVVTFHIYSICLFAARLYNIQMTALIALWRLFLGRKRNPLRGRVDSCKYTPEQLFIGTLGFTILLFLLPTTLIYYVVFTCLRVFLTTLKGTLARIRYAIYSLQIYSTVLWLTGSPKVCSEIHLVPRDVPARGQFLLFDAKPVCGSWKEAILHDKINFVEKPKKFNLLGFLYSILIGTVDHA